MLLLRVVNSQHSREQASLLPLWPTDVMAIYRMCRFLQGPAKHSLRRRAGASPCPAICSHACAFCLATHCSFEVTYICAARPYRFMQPSAQCASSSEVQLPAYANQQVLVLVSIRTLFEYALVCAPAVELLPQGALQTKPLHRHSSVR